MKTTLKIENFRLSARTFFWSPMKSIELSEKHVYTDQDPPYRVVRIMTQPWAETTPWPYFSVPRPQKHCQTTSETLYWLTGCIETILCHQPLHFNNYLQFCAFLQDIPKIDVQEILENQEILKNSKQSLVQFLRWVCRLPWCFPRDELLESLYYFFAITVSYS